MDASPKSAISFLGALAAALALVALAFAAIMSLGWAAVQLVGRPLFHHLPAPLAYLVTAVTVPFLVYGGLVLIGKLATRAGRSLRKQTL